MKIIDSLIKILPKLKNFNFKNIVRLHIGINIGNKTTINKNTILIDYSKLSSSEKKILNILPTSVEEGIDILEVKFEQKKENYIKVIGDDENHVLLQFFSDKLPPSDITILKASLYLKSLLELGKETGSVKKDIVYRYGRRGINISNLCSANYFITWIKPLYLEMSKSPDFTLQKFHNVYNEIVENSPFALFVNQTMSSVIIKEEIKHKVEDMKKYGVLNLNIHGIGDKNIKSIREAIDQFAVIDGFSKHIEEDDKIIVVRLKKLSTKS